LIEQGARDRHGSAGWFTERHPLRQLYLIFGYGNRGLGLPYILSDPDQGILPVFSSEETAREFLSSSSLGERWCIRSFSSGELVSVLFAFHAGMKGVLLDPHPGSLAGDVSVSLVGRDAYMTSLLETGSHRPKVGTSL
jgi:hypothetical protein